MRLSVRLCTARCFAIGLFSAFVAFLAVPAYAQTEVPSDWPLKPSGLNVGDEFRLMFMGKNSREANSTDIAVYDAYVQGRIAAIGHAEIKAHSSHFKVLGSTGTVNARTHTGTTGTGGVPIYWLNGAKVADNYTDFYDGSWTNKLSARLEDGTVISQNRRDQPICTGTNDNGTTAINPLGVDPCTATTIDSANTLSGTTHPSSSSEEPRYLVLSGVFRVGNFTSPTIPVVERVAVTSDPGSDGEYVKDDAIKVTVTFSEAVAVTGTPKIKMRLVEGAMTVKPRYVAADSTATALVFSYTVKATDYSHDGVIFPRNGIVLGNGGAIENQAGAVDADLDYAAIEARSGHKIHVHPEVDSVTVASTPASGTSYATGETIQIDLTFDRKVSVFTGGGTPTLGVVIGTTTRQAAYTTTVGDDVVRFEYVVQASDSDPDGIQVHNHAITWNGGFIIRQEHGDVADKASLLVRANGGTMGTTPFSGHGVNAVDVLGVDVDPTSLPVAEGGNDYYSVVLTAQPSGTVTVTPSVTGSSDVTVNPASLTFTTVNWSVSQDVTVSAAQDADADADTATIEHTVSGADYGSVVADDVAVTVTEDDRVSTKVTLTVSTPTLAESAGATQVTVTGELNGVPVSTATVVTVSVGASADTATEGTDYTAVNDLTLTIPANLTSATVNFELTPVNDDVDEVDEALTVDGTVQGLTVTPATVTITDDDTRGVNVSRTTLPVAEGGSDTYTVVLTSKPTGQVTVALSRSGSSDVTVAPSPLTFTTGNWSTAQTVTVSAAHDLDADADTATIEHAVSGADYGSENADDVAVTVTEDETQSSKVTLTVSAPTVAEDAGATQVTVTAELDAVPRASATVVTVSVGTTGEPATEGTDYIAVNDFSLTIPADQTSATADFTLTPVDDGFVEVDETLSVDGTVQGLTVTPATMTITDNDTLGLVLSAPSLSVLEGARSTYTLVLGSQPTATVTVDITGATGTDLTLDKTGLTFTTLNWDVPQTVRVTAAQDNNDSLDDEVTLTHTASGGDYAALSVDLMVTVEDNDAAAIYAGGVTVVSSPLYSSNAYGRGETIRIQAAFNVAVVVDTSGGTPAIQVNFGNSGNVAVTKEFEYARGSGSSRLEFKYEVQPGDIDGDGLDLVDNGLVLNGATIKDTRSGRDAVLLYTGGEQGDHLVVGSSVPDPIELTSLALSGITLSPAFAATETSYSASVGYDVFETTVTAVATAGSVSIRPADADSTSGHQVALATGANEITITASQNGITSPTYTVTVTRASTSVSIAAGASSATYRLEDMDFTVTRAETSGQALDVDLTISQGQSFLAASKLTPTVTIPANRASAKLTLQPSDFSSSVSADGRLTATVQDGDEFDLGSPASASIDFVVADPAVIVRLEQSSYSFLENAGTVTVNVVAETAAGVPQPTSLSIGPLFARHSNETAVHGQDFTFSSTTVSFQASDYVASGGRFVATKALSLPLINDTMSEGDETLSIILQSLGQLPSLVDLTQADGSPCGGQCSSQVTIIDDESPPAQVTGVKVTPGQSALDVNWDAVASADGYKVQWKSGSQSFADAATDSREAIVSSGSTTSHSIIGLTDGTLYTVRVIATRSGAPSDGAASSEVTGTPGMPTLTIADASATEGSAVEFTVTLSPAAATDVTVEYATTDGTATSDSSDLDGADYTAPTSGAELTISAGSTSATISIATGNDTVDEDDETFTVTLSSPSSNAALGADKTATGTIEDDDVDAAQVTNAAFTNAPSDGMYGLGDVIEVSVTFDAAVDVTGSPRIALQLPGAPAADRYALYDGSASSDTVLVFRKTVTAAVDDMDGTGVAADALELNGGGIVNKDTTVAAVLDHDALSGGNIRTRIISGIEITSDPSVATPAGYYGGGETVEFTASFSQAVTVSGTPQLKFIASDQGRQTAVYASGTGSAELVFTWTVPADVPGGETPIEIPTNIGTGGALLTDGGLVLNGGTIQDSSARDVNIRHGQYTTDSEADTTGPALVAGAEGATVAGTQLVLTFERAVGVAEHLDENSVPATSDFAVVVQSAGRTVSAVAVSGATVTLTLSEPMGHAQTVTVRYTPGVNPIKDLWGNDAPGFTSRAVRNDSPEPELSAADLTVDEGAGTAEFTVTLDVVSGETVTVDYATSNGTAEAGSDYTAKSGTLTFAAGDTEKKITVTVADDSLSEGTEDFTLTLSNPSNASIDVATATATITDNEGTPTLTIADVRATEGSAVEFTVTLDPASSSDVTVEYATTDGTATADSTDPDGADYTAPASGAELTIGAEQTLATISIATGNDTVDEDDETFTLTLSGQSSNAVLGAANTATGTIEDDDTGPAVITNLRFTNKPADGIYNFNEVIEVSVTFDQDVEVTGTPQIKITQLIGHYHYIYADYDAAVSTDRELVFRLRVTGDIDDSSDGLRIGADRLQLNGGGIRNKGTTVGANRSHDQVISDLDVRTRLISDMQITSDPAVATPAGFYGPGETVEFTVTFSQSVKVKTDSGVPALFFRASDSGLQQAAYASGSESSSLVFAWTVPADVPGAEDAIKIPTNIGSGVTLLTDAGLVLNGGIIQALGRVANIRHGQYTTSSQADTTGPALAAGAQGATVNGTELELTFERKAGVAEHLDETSVPAASGFAVLVQSVARTVSAVAVDGATVTLTLSEPVGHAQTVTVGYTPGTAPLKDVWGNDAPGFSGRAVRNDSPEPELSVANVTVDEGDGTAEFTVMLGVVSGESLTVDYATSDGSAEAGSDYTATSGALSIAAGQTQMTIEVPLSDDSLSEGAEDFTLTLSNPSNASIDVATATATITDNEGTPTLTIADARATEGSAVEFTVTLDPASSSDVTVEYATTDGTATADSADPDGADYTAPASGAELTISAEQTSGTISIATGNDTVFEADETFTVTLSSPSSNAVLGTNPTTTGTIENDDTASTDAALKSLAITAGGSSAVLTPAFAAGVYSYRAYVENTVASVSIAAEANHRKATVTIIEGTDLAFGENTLTLRVTAEDGGTTQDYTVTVTRALPELRWEGQTERSFGEGAGEVELTVTLTPASSDQVTVDYATLPAGAVAGEDYTQASGTLTFAAGETQKTIAVTILDDTLYELGATDGILVELSNATGTAEIGWTSVILQIQDNESPPAATMENVTVDEGAGTMVFTLSLAHGIDTDIEYRANANEVGGTATEGADYSPFIPGTGVVKLGVSAQQTSATFSVTILDDDVHEADETISMRWSENSGHVATPSVDVTGTITNDDERGVTVTPTSLTVPEDGTGTYTVVLTSQPTGQVTVAPSVSGSSDATVAPSPLTFTTGNWSTAQTVTVSAAADTDAVNDTATVSHAVSGGDYGSEEVADVSVTVSDDETVSTGVVLSVNPETVSEDAGVTVVTVTGTLNHAPRLADTVVTVTVGDAGDAATEGTDYGTVGNVTLTVAAGSSSGTATFTLTPTDDDVDEGDEALTVDGSVTGLDVTSAALTIEDDDERGVTVTPTSLTVPEGGSATYTVVLTSQPTGEVTVTPSVSGSSDVTLAPSPLTFTTGNWSTAQTVTVSAAADTDAVNDTAVVTHAVSGADYGTNNVTAADVSVTVSDDETVSTGVVLSVNPETVSEDAVATVVTVTGTLDHAPRLADTVVTVTVGDAGDAATEGTDYETVGNVTLTVAAGSSSGTATFTLTPTDDDVDEGDEALTVDGSFTGLDVTSAALTIEDDDERGVTVTPTSLTVPEDGTGTYTMVLTSQPTGPVTVTPSVSGSPDVTLAPSPLTFTTGNWSTAQTVTVSAAADSDATNDTATVSHAVSGADYGTNNVTVADVSVTVSDDETVSTGVVLSVNPETVSEDAVATVVTVTGTLDHAPRLADTVVTVTVGDAGDAATEGTDYETVGNVTLTVAAGSASGTATFTLTPTDDDVDEGDEALTVDGSVTGLDVTSAVLTIEDDDERGVTVTPTSLTMPEGGSATYTVVLTSQPTGEVTVTPSVSGSPDVTLAPSPLTFTTGNWSTAQTVTVSAAADSDATNDTAVVTHAVSGGDYGSEAAADVSVTVSDDETVSTGVVLSVNPETVSEDAVATVVTVTGTLDHAPRLADTVVTVTVGDAGDAATEGTDYETVGNVTLTVAAGSASGTATFTLTPTDDDVDEGDEALTVDGSVTGLDVTSAALTIEDDDERGVTVTSTSLTVPEGGSATYTVVLGSRPTGTVTVTPTVSGSPDVTLAPSPLTFTTGNWSTAQTVTVSAAADSDATNDTAVVTHAVSGGDYGSEAAADVSVTVSDDETVSTGVVLSVNPETVSEDAVATVVTVTGTLDHAPRLADTVVTVTVGDAGDAATEGTDYETVGNVTLTVAAGSASGTATFTLTPTDDDVDEGDEALTVDGSVTGLDVTSAVLTIEDDDERGVTVTPTSLTMPEDGSATYTVVLGSWPTGTVTVTPTVSGSPDVTLAPSPLTFTTGNWSTAQTVTVSAAADSDATNDTATIEHTVAGADYGSEAAADVSVTVSDDETVSDIPGQVTGLSATASVNKARLAWTAPLGAILGYRIEASYDGGSVWVDVEANTNSTDTSYAHGSGLMAGEIRHYRVSAINGEGAGPVSVMVEANATDTVNGLTAIGVAIEDTPNGMATIDLCWKPAGVAVNDLRDFAIRERSVHPSLPTEWSDQHWSPRSKSTAADCEAGSIGFRVTGIAPNIRYAYQIRARYGMRWGLSNDAEAVSVDTALVLRADVLTGNSSLSVDTDVPATVCPAYDDPVTPENEAGSFIVNIGFSTGPAVILNYEAVTGFVLADDVTLENATAELIDRPYGPQLGYRVRITPTTWGQTVAVSVPAGVVTHPASSVTNQTSNVFRRNTTASTDCDTGSDITVYPPAVRRAEILDDDDRSGMWSTGERVRATLEFTEPVTVTTDNGIPTVSLSIDGKTVQASYAEGTGGDTLAFEHVVTAEQSPFNSASLVANSLSLNGGAIASLDGPAATLAHPGAVKQKKPATEPNKPAPEPSLTAKWVKFPPGHSGDGRKFTIRVKFSDPVTINVRYFRDYTLSVTGGVVNKVWRVKGSDGERRRDMWAIRVMPTSQQPLSLSLAAKQDCNEHGAICTADGTPLSKAASITVPGPNHDIVVADAEVEEGPGAALAFVVALSGTAPYRVKVDYRTSDGTATAGSDYTATNGTLIFERGETSKTVSVPVLDDAHDDDGETLTLTLSNPLRAMIVDGEAVGTIRNSDHMPTAWIARFGRTVADQVLDAVDARLRAARTTGVSVSLAGQTIGAALKTGSGAASDVKSASLFGGTAEDAGETARLKALSDWLNQETAENDQSSGRSRTLTGHELLMGSSFSLAAQTDGGGFAALWGRMAQTSFAGREDSLRLDGDVTTGLLGMDYASGPWTTGLVVSHSIGEGGYRGDSSGEIEATVTALTPWARYAVTERLSVWGAVGYGAGDLTLTAGDDPVLKTDLGMMLVAAGARGTLVGGDGPKLDAVTDALRVRTTTAEVSSSEGKLASASAEVTLLRLGLEGSWRLALGNGAVVTPHLAIGVRDDTGDAETGFGTDIGGGVTFEAPAHGLKVSLEGRGVLTHEASGFRDRGVSGTLAWNPPSAGLGPNLALSQTIGAGATGGDALLSRDSLDGLAANDNDNGRRLEAQFGYGFSMFGDRFTMTPEIGLGLSEAGRDYSLGWRLTPSGSGAGSLGLSLEARRRESVNDNTPPEHGIGFRLTARF